MAPQGMTSISNPWLPPLQTNQEVAGNGGAGARIAVAPSKPARVRSDKLGCVGVERNMKNHSDHLLLLNMSAGVGPPDNLPPARKMSSDCASSQSIGTWRWLIQPGTGRRTMFWRASICQRSAIRTTTVSACTVPFFCPNLKNALPCGCNDTESAEQTSSDRPCLKASGFGPRPKVIESTKSENTPLLKVALRRRLSASRLEPRSRPHAAKSAPPS